MPPKKPPGEKYKQMTITIEPGLFSSVKEKTQEPISSLISRLLTNWLESPDETAPSQSSHSYVTRDEIEALQKKLDELVSINTYRYAHEEPPISVDTYQPVSRPVDNELVSGVLDERDRLIQKVTKLMEAGMGVMEIARAIGIAHGTISKLKDREKYPDTKLKPEQAEKLLSL